MMVVSPIRYASAKVSVRVPAPGVRFAGESASPPESPQPSRVKQALKKYGPWAILFFTVKGIITSSLLGGAVWGLFNHGGCSSKSAPPVAPPQTLQAKP